MGASAGNERNKCSAALLVMVGTVSTYWLPRPPEGFGYRREGPEDLLLGAVTFLAFVVGLALLVIGRALFRPIELLGS